MQQNKVDIKSMSLAELTAYMEAIGEKRFRAKQLYEWMHKKQAASFDDMTNIPKALTKKLINRGTTKYYCISCLAKAFEVTEQDLQKKIQYYKEIGCTLFT